MQKPQLSFWQIWNMSFGFLGIQFGWGLQMANMSPIYKYLGASDSQIPLLWLAAPLTGFLVQPIIGAMSDRTWGRLGRRRPYFLVGAILSSLALVLMPNCSTLWMAAGLLWILDASINVSMEPFRAFVADKNLAAARLARGGRRQAGAGRIRFRRRGAARTVRNRQRQTTASAPALLCWPGELGGATGNGAHGRGCAVAAAAGAAACAAAEIAAVAETSQVIALERIMCKLPVDR